MRRARFLIVFFALLAVFQLPLLIPAVDRSVVHPFTAGLASASGVALNLIGQGVQVTGTVIAGRCFAVDLKNGCNAVEATLFLVAAVLAFPVAPARERILAALAGAATLQIVNFIRILSLYLLGCYRRNWFDAFHLAIWQSIMFALAVAMFAVWTRRMTVRHAD